MNERTINQLRKLREQVNNGTVSIEDARVIKDQILRGIVLYKTEGDGAGAGGGTTSRIMSKASKVKNAVLAAMVIPMLYFLASTIVHIMDPEYSFWPYKIPEAIAEAIGDDVAGGEDADLTVAGFRTGKGGVNQQFPTSNGGDGYYYHNSSVAPSFDNTSAGGRSYFNYGGADEYIEEVPEGADAADAVPEAPAAPEARPEVPRPQPKAESNAVPRPAPRSSEPHVDGKPNNSAVPPPPKREKGSVPPPPRKQSSSQAVPPPPAR